MCPEKPGWFTAVALRRHQKSHHLGLKGYHCDIAYCESAFTTNSVLKQHKINIHGIHAEWNVEETAWYRELNKTSIINEKKT